MESIIDELLKQGAINYNNRNFIQAEECYRKIIKLKPNHVGAHNNLGIIETLKLML